MTEKDKMLSGLLFYSGCEELRVQRRACKEACYEYNQLRPNQTVEQEAALKRLFGKTKDRLRVMAPFWCDYGSNIEVGEDFYVNHDCVILDCAKVIFGDHVLIAPHCGFYTVGHPLDTEQRNQGLLYAHPITVGDNVWIGAGVSVLPGVTIGSNTVIAAGSVVNRDVPSGVVAAGNPCRVIRKIT